MRFATKMVKYWKKIWKYWLSVPQTWHKKWTSLKKPNDSYGAVAIERNVLAPVSFCQKRNILESGRKGPAWNRHGSHIVLTLIIRLAGVDGPWLKQRLGREDQRQNCCHGNSTTGVILFRLWWTFLVPSLRSTAFMEIFFVILVANLMTSSLSQFD